jgi:intracellular sulfur oxidation DsrE/DsrF family protein
MNLKKIGLFVTCLVALSAPLTVTATSTSADMRAIVKVNKQGHYKAVYDIHSNETTAGVSKGLYYARGLIEAFAKQGVKPSQVDVHLVLHAEAAKFLLNDDSYQMAVNDPFTTNINAKIVQELHQLGVHVEICNSTMKSMGWTAKDILPTVVIIHDGYTRLVQLENEGYAYIGGF